MLHTLGGQPGEGCLLLLGPVDNRSAGRFGDLDPIRDAPTLSLLLSRFARSTPDWTSVLSDSTAGGAIRGRNPQQGWNLPGSRSQRGVGADQPTAARRLRPRAYRVRPG